MATTGMMPTFITGANARVKVDGKTFAYASDVSYSIGVDVIPIETMGRYEAASLEPVNYSVAGELAVVRYTKLAVSAGRGENLQGKDANGNGLGNVTGVSGQNLSGQFNPGVLLKSKTWDLDVYQKKDQLAGDTGIDATAVIKIKDCRFTSMSAGLTKRGILVDRFRFMGILAGDDSFFASNSGDQDLSAN